MLAVFNRFSTGRSDWLAVVFHAVMAMLPEALTGIEGLGEDGGDLVVDDDDLGAHGGDLCLSTRGGDGGVEEEGHVEHLALQQQPGSLLHLVEKEMKQMSFKVNSKLTTHLRKLD